MRPQHIPRAARPAALMALLDSDPASMRALNEALAANAIGMAVERRTARVISRAPANEGA